MALDLVAAPASEAFCERTFSVCGILTVGRRNRMKMSQEKSLFEAQQEFGSQSELSQFELALAELIVNTQ